MKKIISTLIILIAFVLKSNAQDYHFSQFDALVPTYQPALTGMFKDYNYRSATQYRNQWRPLATKPFSTFAIAYDMPIDQRWGVGGYIINYDGARVFNSFNLVASGAYRITDPGQKDHLLTTGLQMGIIYKNTNNRDLLFDSQYSNGTFNPELEDNEDFQRFSKLMPEFNLGFYYEWIDPRNKYHPYAGASIFHVSSPKENLQNTDEATRLPRRYLFNTGSKFDISKEFKADLKFMYQMQGKAREFVLGAMGSYYMMENDLDLNLGVYYRWDDAIIISCGMDYKELLFMLSYDITTSGLKDFNNGFGALEFMMAFRPKKK